MNTETRKSEKKGREEKRTKRGSEIKEKENKRVIIITTMNKEEDMPTKNREIQKGETASCTRK